MTQLTLTAIHAYPIKGLAGAPLPRTSLAADGIPHDRRFGIARTESATATATVAAALFHPDTPWKPWNHFVSLKNTPQAAGIQAAAHTDGAALAITLRHSAGAAVRADYHDPAGKTELEQFLSDILKLPHPRLIDCAPHRIWDEHGIPITLLSTASVTALSRAAAHPLSPARFRANLIYTGAPAWQEENWTGAIRIGPTAVLRAAGGVPRCKATTVNPTTHRPDCNPPQFLVDARGHNELGTLAHITTAGDIAPGMQITHEPTP